MTRLAILVVFIGAAFGAETSLRGEAATHSRAAVTALQALEHMGVDMDADDKNQVAKDITEKGLGHAMWESVLQFHTPKSEGTQLPAYEKIYKALKEKIHPWVNLRDALEIVKDAR